MMLTRSGGHRHRIETVAVTDPAVAKTESLQLELGERPRLAAL